ncbi:MAG: LacI family DNA-binding transcriptional regulator, partial [Kiritimatiellae bacterium]|nr:LacI family DNA-binding transcriptional regulator [Kiritimatiellia bacterium]
SLLDAALARSVDLAIVLYNRTAIFRHLAAHGVPFAAVAGIDAPPDGAVGLTSFDYNAAVPGFIAACRAAGARRVVQFRVEHFLCDAVPALRAAGFATSSVSLRADPAKGKLLGIEDAGLRAFARALASPRFDRDAIYFFASEYLARGALAAMMDAGVRAPDDIRVATWATAGTGPAYFRDLARMEMDSTGAGDAVADAAIAYLKTGAYPDGSSFAPRWIGGETMRR